MLFYLHTNMAVKWLILSVIVILFISGCSIGDKTKAVVTDVDEKTQEQEIIDVEEQELEEDGEVLEKENETIEDAETEINESEDEPEEKLPPGTHTITIKDLKLDPQELTIKKGDTVVWKHEDKWEDNTQHYLAAHSNEFRSEQYMYYGDTFNHTFDDVGTFTY
ncbi:unnamed protein product, partial [marine sediment metagenome]